MSKANPPQTILAQNTVEVLNAAAGKTGSGMSPTKRTATAAFGPDNIPLSAGGSPQKRRDALLRSKIGGRKLQRKRPSTPSLPRRSKQSFSPLGEDYDDGESDGQAADKLIEGATKKGNQRQRGLKSRKTAAEKASPLKKVGFDPSESGLAGKANLADGSPAKATRQQPKKANPLTQLTGIQAKQLQPISNVSRRRSSRFFGMDNGTKHQLLVLDEHGQAKTQTENLFEKSDDIAAAGTDTVADQSQTQSPRLQHNEQQMQTPNSKRSRREETSGDPDECPEDSASEEVVNTQGKSQATTEKRLKKTTQKKTRVDNEDEKERMAAFRSQFLKGIENASARFPCQDALATAGAVGLYLHDLHGPQVTSPLQTTNVRSLSRYVDTLKDLYKLQAKGRAITSSRKKVENEIPRVLRCLESAADRIEESGNHDKDQQYVLDLYRLILPSAVSLLKCYLELPRLQDTDPDLQTLTEFRRLVAATATVCDKACTWSNRPTLLEHGTLQFTKQRLLPSLRRIVDTVDQTIDGWKHRDWQRESALDLRRRQLIAEQVIQGRIDQMYGMPSTGRPMQNSSHRKNASDVNVASDQRRYARQISPTASESSDGSDIVPAPPAMASWPSDQDKADRRDDALLRGLWRHTGKHRFRKIKDDFELGGILMQYSVQDLHERALYLKSLIRSHLAPQDRASHDFLLCVGELEYD